MLVVVNAVVTVFFMREKISSANPLLSMNNALNCMHMQLLALHLENFRNYESLDLDLSKHQVTALIGPNAQGKTNLLESIAFLALGKSFRTHHSMETLGWERPHGRIRGTISRDSKETDLEVFFQRDPEAKKMKKGNSLVPPNEFLGNLRVVLFAPDHLELITGSPALRRQYIDRILVQIDTRYLDALSNYQRLLRQRNRLLKLIQSRTAHTSELDVWDARLVSEAEIIWQKRKDLLVFISRHIGEFYKKISGTDENLTLTYQFQEERFAEKLVAHRDADIRVGATSVGPHRDDFLLALDGKTLTEFGSRGECRSAVLALKLAEIHFIEDTVGSKPLLLLDDVFSELDSGRQFKLSELLKDYQSIITTTSTDHIAGLKDSQVFEVKNGLLSKK